MRPMLKIVKEVALSEKLRKNYFISKQRKMKINHRRKNPKRAEYTGSKKFDYTCRNHGSCGWCESNRLHHRHKIESEAAQDINFNWEDFWIDEYYWCDECYDAESYLAHHDPEYWKKYVDNGKS